MKGRLVIAVLLVAASLLFPLAMTRGLNDHSRRVNLFPKFQPGQTLTYQIRYRLDKNVRTQSKVASPLGPSALQIDVLALLRTDAVDAESNGAAALVHGRSRFQILNAGVSQDPSASAQRTDPAEKFILFTIAADGQVSDVKGLDALSPEQQQAWGDWISLFTAAASFPPNGVKLGQKWESTKPEKSSSPIARLVWGKRSTYVRDEPCGSVQLGIDRHAAPAGQPPDDMCAVILTTETLKQESSRKDATPEDYKLHNLQTKGTARGANQVILYLSLKTGFLVRATEEANQTMDVVIAKKDGTNAVHYNVDAKSNSEVLLVADTLLVNP